MHVRNLDQLIHNSLESIKTEVNTRHYFRYHITFNDVLSIYCRAMTKPFTPNEKSILDYKSQHKLHALMATGKYYNMYYK